MPEDVFRWGIAVAVLLACVATVWQAVILAAIYRAGKEAQKAGREAQHRLGPLVDRFEALAGREAQHRLGPLVDRFEALITTSSKILEENRPRIADITAETLVIAKTARQQA